MPEEKVVITGMGLVSPIGNDLAAFRDSLFAGRHGVVPIDHIDTADMAVRLYAPVKDLQPQAYYPTNEVRRLDNYSLFGLIAARQAVLDSGITGSIDPFRLGVYMSTGLGGVGTVLAEHDKLQQTGARSVSPMLIPKWISNMLAGLVSIEHGARGPAVSHVAACASSAVSIGEGLRAIRHGYADAMICGGAESVTQKLVLAGFQNLRALTVAVDPDRASIPFDRGRTGFVMGEGGAALVLESESHARARGASIHAQVSGYGITSDASHITAPADDGEAIDRAITDALAEAGGSDEPVHVNAHGTSTVLNDQLEAAAISRILGQDALVSSTKSVTGHMLGAAGAAEAIAAVLALHHRAVPPTAGTETLSSGMDIDVVRGEARPAGSLSRAVSLSLGFGGHNVCLVLDR